MRLIRPTPRLTGVGIHSGKPAWVQVCPPRLPTQVGYRFRAENDVDFTEAKYSLVSSTGFRTELASKFRTIEHLLASLWGARVIAADCVVGGDSGELPILDGSASAFLHEINQVSVHDTRRPPFIIVQKSVEVRSSDAGAFARLDPPLSDKARTLDLTLDVTFPPKGSETAVLTLDWLSSQTAELFATEAAPARTFANENDISQLHRMGLGLGGNESNCIVFSSVTGEPINTTLRFPNERARHKLLDVIGDLALAQGFLVGRFTGNRTGHGLNNALLRALFGDTRNYSIVL